MERRKFTLESTSAEDVGISDASGYIGGRCCSHRLNLPRPTSRRRRCEVRLHREAPGNLAGGMVV